MKRLKVGICMLDEDENVIAKRVIGANWEINDEQDLKRNFDVCMMEEISNILTDNLKRQLESNIVKEMLDEIS